MVDVNLGNWVRMVICPQSHREGVMFEQDFEACERGLGTWEAEKRHTNGKVDGMFQQWEGSPGQWGQNWERPGCLFKEFGFCLSPVTAGRAQVWRRRIYNLRR